MCSNTRNKGLEFFKNLRTELVKFVDDVSSMEVATLKGDEVVSYTRCSIDGDTISFLNADYLHENDEVIAFHKSMIILSRKSKNAFTEMLNDIL